MDPPGYFYGFYSDDLWAKKTQHYAPAASKDLHSHCTTRNVDNPKTVQSRRAFCSCPSCVPNCEFANCLVKRDTGLLAIVRCEPVTPVRGEPTAAMSLTEFSESLKAGVCHAMCLQEDEHDI